MVEAATQIPEIHRGEIARSGQHMRGPNGGYSAPSDLPQLAESAMAANGDCVEVILDCDWSTPAPSPEDPDPAPQRQGVLELRFFLHDDNGEQLPPVRVRLPAEILPQLAGAISAAKRTAASRFDFLDNIYANR
jgi:hypothetical protein